MPRTYKIMKGMVTYMNKIAIAELLCRSASEIGFVETLYLTFGNTFNVVMPYSRSACDTNVDSIDFSVRSNNALKRSGLMTVGDVIDAIMDERLMGVRNLGKKSYIEIKVLVLKFGYDLLSEREKVTFFRELLERNCD